MSLARSFFSLFFISLPPALYKHTNQLNHEGCWAEASQYYKQAGNVSMYAEVVRSIPNYDNYIYSLPIRCIISSLF